MTLKIGLVGLSAKLYRIPTISLVEDIESLDSRHFRQMCQNCKSAGIVEDIQSLHIRQFWSSFPALSKKISGLLIPHETPVLYLFSFHIPYNSMALRHKKYKANIVLPIILV